MDKQKDFCTTKCRSLFCIFSLAARGKLIFRQVTFSFDVKREPENHQRFRRAGSDGLRYPASTSCLGRHSCPADRGPNSSSLYPPQAAVVAVARKGLLAPFRPRRRSRSGKMLAASLNAFFSFLHFTASPMALCLSRTLRPAKARSLLRSSKSAAAQNAVKRSSCECTNLQHFELEPTSLGLLGASSP